MRTLIYDGLAPRSEVGDVLLDGWYQPFMLYVWGWSERSKHSGIWIKRERVSVLANNTPHDPTLPHMEHATVDAIDFGQIRAGESKTLSSAVRPEAGWTVSVTSMTSSCPWDTLSLDGENFSASLGATTFTTPLTFYVMRSVPSDAETAYYDQIETIVTGTEAET